MAIELKTLDAVATGRGEGLAALLGAGVALDAARAGALRDGQGLDPGATRPSQDPAAMDPPEDFRSVAEATKGIGRPVLAGRVAGVSLEALRDGGFVG